MICIYLHKLSSSRSTEYDVTKLNIVCVCVCVMFCYSVKSHPLFLTVDKDNISNTINMGWIHSLHSQKAINFCFFWFRSQTGPLIIRQIFPCEAK